MADLTYRVNVETRAATKALQDLQSTATSLTSVLEGFLAVLGTAKIIAFADSITNVRNRLNLLAPTQQAVNEQFLALSAIAIRARTPLEQTTDLYFRIARNADALGISLQEAGQITESVGKALVASGVSAQEAAGPLLQLGQALASGRFQGDELRSILEGLPPVANALAKQLNVPIGALKELGSQGKISAQDFVNAMRAARDSIEQDFARTAPTIGQALTNVQTSFGVFFDALNQTSGAGASLATFLEYIAAEIFFLKDSVSEVIGPLTTFVKILGFIVSFTVIGRVLRGVGAAVSALAKSFSTLSGAIGTTITGILSFLGIKGISDKIEESGTAGTSAADKIKRFREELAKLATNLPTAAGPGTPAYIDPTKLAKAREEITKISETYQRTLQDQQKRLELENSLVGVSEQQKQVKTALADLESGYLKTVTDLMQKYREASISGKEEDAAKLKEIEKQLQIVSEAYGQQIGVVQQLTEENFRLNEAYKQRQALTEFAIKSEIDLNKKVRDIQHEIATSTMTNIEKKYADIRRAAEETARAAIEQENSRRRSLGLVSMTAQEEQQYRDAAKKGTEELLAAERQAYEQSRTFSTGWKKAFNDYVDNATNAASQAQRIFQKTTQGMEDMIVNFAKTGKFEFKSFINSILEDLLRSQIRQVMAQVFALPSAGGKNTGGGLFGAVGNLLGFANGGIIPTNAPVVVGERGPELLMGASGRQVIPNEQLGTSTNVTYNINAVDASSFKALVAADPSFIHAVAMQGSKAMPGRR